MAVGRLRRLGIGELMKLYKVSWNAMIDINRAQPIFAGMYSQPAITRKPAVTPRYPSAQVAFSRDSNSTFVVKLITLHRLIN